ncbi:aminoglycoside phosphotransferase family protein [Novosphingobium mangrovi (ex Huang et al. 2023)]|uniref:Aminoglycoside phosphotransferase family protein n=1 Tax=Novosphingobium mangrovi (ex Huang et al. 2023) TaxID=2976432 RepID=A0ABT2I4Q2_9SPHN|nr:aminoglycoside phosphotransferase family protein [Novosphingobium mangrovi (ex Huang et al. 2023)]MCT2399787.1 aminoglycoside phosphotransferase family protein [Novosphingobium mangrovi (ex Huang et al. 2023)]
MSQAIARRVPSQPRVAVPATLAEALDAAWLGEALAAVSGSRAIVAVRQVEVIRTVATKVRFAVTFEDGEVAHFCLKGLLDVDSMTARGGPTCVLEADFYGKVAPITDVRVPDAVATVIDREAQQAVTIMRDLTIDGAAFCSALDPFTADDAVMSLEQLSLLHARSAFLDEADWIRPRAAELAKMSYVTPDMLQELLDGPRGDNLSSRVRNAQNLAVAIKALAVRDSARPQFMIHGDAHAGNTFRTGEGMGLIDWQLLQRGGWALDVAYHLNAVLPTEIAETDERRLLGEYLAMMRGQGMTMPNTEEAWMQYREAVTYGYYLWSITRRVDPPIIVQFTDRLGKAVMRHDSFGLLGVS